MANANGAFDALGDPTRRRLFERLSRKPHSVAELADGAPVTRPAVSQHLKVLLAAHLVKVTQEGARRVYHVDPRGVTVMRDYLDKHWEQSLAAFKSFVESQE